MIVAKTVELGYRAFPSFRWGGRGGGGDSFEAEGLMAE